MEIPGLRQIVEVWRVAPLGGGLLLLFSATLADTPVFRVPPPPMGQKFLIYELQAPDLTAADALRIARQNGFAPVRPAPNGNSRSVAADLTLFTGPSQGARMIFRPAAGSLEMLPDLAQQKQSAPEATAAVTQAEAWLKQSGLLKLPQSLWQVSGVATSSLQTVRRQGGHPPAIPAVQMVVFFRDIGGLPVKGPNSVLSVSVSAKGIVGFARALRPIRATSTGVTFKSTEEITREFTKALSSVANPGTKSAVKSVKLIYWEQGQRYVQPAYEFLVTVNGPKGSASGHRILIAAARESPEPILTSSAGAKPSSPATRGSSTQAPAAPRKTDPVVQVGIYFDRLDYNQWASDPWSFWQNLLVGYGTASSNITSNYSVNLLQFKFNFPWMWQSAPNYNDYSGQFIDQVHFGIVAGHGAPFSMVTLANWADYINLPTSYPACSSGSAGFGAYNAKQGITDYIVWRGCNFVPSPDPTDTFSGGNADLAVQPWFCVFNGLRGIYGFHTEENISDNFDAPFGQDVGVGGAILSSFFTEVANVDNSCATSEWECPSAVIVSTHENDTIYDLAPVQSPQSLTVWWVSPSTSSGGTSTTVSLP